MSRTDRPRPTGAAVAIGAVIGAVALTGCGAGQLAQTSTQVAAVDGAAVTVGTIAIREAQITYSEDAEGAAIYRRGGQAPLEMRIINIGADADRLVSASSPVAASVQISGDATVPGGQALLVEGEPAASTASAAPSTTAAPSPSPSASSSVSPSPSASSTPSPSPSASPSPSPSSSSSASSAAAPTAGSSSVLGSAGSGSAEGATEAQLVLTGLNDDIRAGLTYPVVLVFEKAGSIRLDVPVGTTGAAREAESTG